MSDYRLAIVSVLAALGGSAIAAISSYLTMKGSNAHTLKVADAQRGHELRVDALRAARTTREQAYPAVAAYVFCVGRKVAEATDLALSISHPMDAVTQVAAERSWRKLAKQLNFAKDRPETLLIEGRLVAFANAVTYAAWEAWFRTVNAQLNLVSDYLSLSFTAFSPGLEHAAETTDRTAALQTMLERLPSGLEALLTARDSFFELLRLNLDDVEVGR